MSRWSRIWKQLVGAREEDEEPIVLATRSALPPSRQARDPFEELYQAGRAIAPPYDPLQLVYLAETNEVHAAALEAVAADVVGQGWYFVGTREAADQAVRDAAIATVERLNPDYTFSELLYQAAWELRAVGWAAWEVVRDERGRIAALYPIPAHTLRLTRDPAVYVQEVGGVYRYFKAFGVPDPLDGTTGEWKESDDPASEVIYFNRYNGRSRYGIPSWVSCIPSIVEYNAIRDYSVAFFDSNGAVGRVVVLQSEQTQYLQPYLEELRIQLDNAVGQHRQTLVLGLPATMKFSVQALGPDVQEASFIRRREDLVKAILMAHSVPPYRVGWAVLGPMSEDTAVYDVRAQAWRPITAFRVGDVVRAYDAAEGRVVEQEVLDTVARHYERAIAFRGKRFEAVVSPDHRMYARIRYGDEETRWLWLTARDLLTFLVFFGSMYPDARCEFVAEGGTTVAIDEVETVAYGATAYCLTVPAGALFYQRGGRAFVAGNSLGGNAAREMLRAYRRGVIEPLQIVLESRVNRTLFGESGLDLVRRGWEWHLKNLDFQETELQLDLVTRTIDRGIITPNEARAVLGFAPVDLPELDQFYVRGAPMAAMSPEVTVPPEIASDDRPTS
ncbi:MAG: phage portal protein [Dehalococcoidia bacterium]|nr:phage portal protein [Dehalococcoidia bacterium]